MKKVVLAMMMLGLTVVNAQTLKEAIKLSDSEQFETAAAAFNKLIQADPANGENYFYFGENFFRSDDVESAKAMYTKGVESNATNPLNYVGLGKYLLYHGNLAEANNNFFKAKTLAKTASPAMNATVHIKIAEALIQSENKNLPEAMNLLNAALKLEPKNPEIYLQLGDAYLEQNDGTNAVKNYEKASELDKTSVKAILRQGQIYSRAKNYNLALDYYKNASKIDSSYAPAYREKAEIYGRAGQFQNAIYNYKRYLALNGNNLTARVRYAQFLYSGKQYKNAVEEIKEIQKQDTTNVNLFRVMGYSLYETGDYAGGLSYMKRFFEKAQKVNKKLLASDYEYLGKNMMKSGQDSLGVVNVMKAIEMDTTRTDLYSDLGLACMKQKKYDCAIKYLEKKIAITPNPGVNDHYNVGRAYYFNKEYVKADSSFSNIIRLQPAMPIGYFWKARANSAQDLDLKLGLAKPHYELFIQKAEVDKEKNKKDLIEAYDYMGSYYGIIKKDLTAAKPFYQKMLELDPENVKAKKFMSSQEGK